MKTGLIDGTALKAYYTSLNEVFTIIFKVQRFFLGLLL